MKKTILGYLVLLLLVCGLPVTLWALPSLLPPTVRTPVVDIRDLMVDATVFPPGWRVVWGPEPESEGERDWGDENLTIKLQPKLQPIDHQAFAYHWVFKFRNEAAAMYGHFWIRREFLFPSHGREVPAGWTYRSPIADAWRFACTDYGKTAMLCTAIARYDEYILVFDSTVSSEYMPLEDLEGVLRAIDERMARNLGKPVR